MLKMKIVLQILFVMAAVLATDAPTKSPTKSPNAVGTNAPTKSPNADGTDAPTKSPSADGTDAPTKSPTTFPTKSPTTDAPTKSPTTAAPTKGPTKSPTKSPTTGAPTNSENLVVYVSRTPELSKLFSVLNNSFPKIVDALNQPDADLVLFAPVNTAFDSFPAANVTGGILKYHVVTKGGTLNNRLKKTGINYVKSFNNDQILKIISKQTDGVPQTTAISGVSFGYPGKLATVSKTATLSNGVIHFVDYVLLPPATNAEVEKAAGLTKFGAKFGALGLSKQHTIFAVKDAAYDAAKIEGFGKSQQDAVIRYSVVDGLVSSNFAEGNTNAKSVLGLGLKIERTGDAITVNGIKVIEANLLTDTDVIHVLESALTVPWRTKDTIVTNIARIGEFSELYKVATKSSIVKNFLAGPSNKTLFAPSDPSLVKANASALPEKKLTDILLYHVVDGKHNYTELTQELHWKSKYVDKKLVGSKQVVIVSGAGDKKNVNNVPITKVLESSDGFVYAIDGLLAIPGSIKGPLKDAGLGLSIFEKLLNLTDLTSVALTSPHLTIFAPNDEGFKAFLTAEGLSFETLDVEVARNLLLSHVYLNKTIYSNDLFKLANLTMGNKTWPINSPYIGGASVVDANILLDNGVVHVIDRVLGGPAPPAPATDDSSGITGGEIVAIVIGVLAFIAIIGYCCFKSKKSKQDDYQVIKMHI